MHVEAAAMVDLSALDQDKARVPLLLWPSSAQAVFEIRCVSSVELIEHLLSCLSIILLQVVKIAFAHSIA